MLPCLLEGICFQCCLFLLGSLRQSSVDVTASVSRRDSLGLERSIFHS